MPSTWDLKWKLTDSLESGLHCVLLRQTCEGVFHRSRHRREDVLLKQAHERTCDERFFANDTHVLVCHREKATKTLLVACYSFLPLPRTQDGHFQGLKMMGRVMSAETDACAEARHMEDT